MQKQTHKDSSTAETYVRNSRAAREQHIFMFYTSAWFLLRNRVLSSENLSEYFSDSNSERAMLVIIFNSMLLEG